MNKKDKVFNGEENMEIKVLGTGCQKCRQTEEHVREAIAEAGVDADIHKVTDLMEITQYGVLLTPAVVIDGEVKSTGTVPTTEEVKSWIGK